MTKHIQNPSGSVDNPAGSTTGTTAAAYGTAITLWMGPYSKALVHIVETGGAESMKYKCHGSILGTTWHEIVAETTLVASADEYETFTDAWRRIRVQVIDGSGHADYRIEYQKKV